MNAALLCPGPSLAGVATDRLQIYSLIAGVNRAACRFRCDFWAAKDLPRVLESGPDVQGLPLLLTDVETRLSLVRRKSPWSEVAMDFDLVDCPVTHWKLYTTPAALMYLAALGCTVIDCYGVDMMGEQDWDGSKAGNNRSESRWIKEVAIWRRLVAYLGRGGVVVRRVMPRHAKAVTESV